MDNSFPLIWRNDNPAGAWCCWRRRRSRGSSTSRPRRGSGPRTRPTWATINRNTPSLLPRYLHSPTASCRSHTHTHAHKTQGPILHPAQLTFYTDACIVAGLHPARSGLLPPQARVGKLGNDLAHPGAVQQKEEACSGANVPWCYFAVLEYNLPQTRKNLV